MKKVSALSVGILLAGLLAAPVYAEQGDPSAVSNGQPQNQGDQGQPQPSGQGKDRVQVTPYNPKESLDAQYKKRVEQKKRAAAMREQLIRQGQDQAPQQQ